MSGRVESHNPNCNIVESHYEKKLNFIIVLFFDLPKRNTKLL
jgi:hypothetical protein